MTEKVDEGEVIVENFKEVKGKNEIEVYTVGDHRMISDSYNTYAMDRNEVENPIKKQLRYDSPYNLQL